MPLFHCAPILLAPGSVILPGNWGRIIRLYQPNWGNPNVALRERVFEDIRISEFSHAVSRLNCTYVLPDIEKAIAYRQSQNHSQLIYEVEPTIHNPPMHSGCWSFGYEPNRLYVFDGLADVARRYWRSEGIINPETLLGCPLRVIRLVDVPPLMVG